jgi:hypothetical protein
MASGYLGKCKECARADQRARYRDKRDHCRAADRERNKTPARREQHHKYGRDYRARYPEKRKAHMAVWRAVRDGRLERQPCRICGRAEHVHAHHENYAEPLKVEWLCVNHHAEAHKP